MSETSISDSSVQVEAPTLREAAMALYRPPFRFHRGYIWDANNQMVSDDEAQDVAQRVRGWGRIGAMPDAAALQDEVGAMIAEALTEFWNRRAALPIVLCDADRELMERALSAMDGLLEWDLSRDFIIPYRARDPIHFAIAALRTRLLRHSEGKE